MKNIDSVIKKAISIFVNAKESAEFGLMAKFHAVMVLIRNNFPETSVRELAEKFGTRGFGKSQIQLGSALVRDFAKAPKMSIYAYSRHSGMLGKVDVSKRLEVAERLQNADGKKGIEAIYTDFGLTYGSKKVATDASDVPVNPLEVKPDRRRIEDFVRLCKAHSMLPVLMEVLAKSDADAMEIAARNALNAVSEKKQAKLRKRAA